MKCCNCKKREWTVKEKVIGKHNYGTYNIAVCGENHAEYYEKDVECPYYDEKEVVDSSWGDSQDGEEHNFQIQCGKCGAWQPMWIGNGFIENMTYKCCECGKMNEVNIY